MKFNRAAAAVFCMATVLIGGTGLGCGGGGTDNPAPSPSPSPTPSGSPSPSPAPSPSPLAYRSRFENAAEGWTVGFADLPADESDRDIYELGFAYKNLPAPLDEARKALLVSGHNRSDDLFMFVKRRFTGLRASSRYRIAFDLEIASNAPESFAGIGGAPGSGVFVKAGASAREPLAVPESIPGDPFPHLRMNLDKGGQAIEGRDMFNLGTVGIPGDETVYRLKRLNNQNKPFAAQTDEQGSLWVIVGTDSGFEGKTDVYYSEIQLTLTPL